MKKLCMLLIILLVLGCNAFAEEAWIGQWITTDETITLDITSEGTWTMIQNGNTLSGTWENADNGMVDFVLSNGNRVPVEYKGGQIILMQTMFTRPVIHIPEPTRTPAEELSSLTPFDVKLTEDGSGLAITNYRYSYMNYDERGKYEEGGLVYEIDIPAEIGGYPVTEIKSISLPNVPCVVVLPDSVTKIHGSAFMSEHNLISIQLSASLKEIGTYAFYKCSRLASIEFPEGFETIGYGAFAYTAISECHIPASVKTLYGNPFPFCSNFTKITVDPENAVYRSINNNILIAVNQTEIFYIDEFGDRYYLDEYGDQLVAVYGEAARNLELDKNIYSIGRFCFAGNQHLETLAMHDHVLFLSSSSFEDCANLRAISLSTQLASMGNDTFKDCAALESITLPPFLSYIGQNVFDGCSNLKSAVITTKAPFEIADAAFADCTSLESISLPAVIERFNVNAFVNCSSLREIVMLGVPKNLEKYERYAKVPPFSGCPSDMILYAPEDAALREIVESSGYTFMPLEMYNNK